MLKEIHTQSKAETYTVEEHNSLFRHFLARLKRKTKCYTKNVNRLKKAVTTLTLKRDNQLNIIGEQCQFNITQLGLPITANCSFQ